MHIYGSQKRAAMVEAKIAELNKLTLHELRTIATKHGHHWRHLRKSGLVEYIAVRVTPPDYSTHH